MSGRISRVAWRPFSVPFRTALATASATWTRRDGFIIRIETARGLAGLGEASPLPGASQAVVDARIGQLAARIVGRSPSGALLADVRMDAAPSATFGVELALADIQAQVSGQSMGEWLVAAHQDVGRALPGPSLPVNALVDAAGLSGLAASAEAAVEAGFTTIKLKVGGPPDVDVARIRTVREAVGAGVALRIDANGAWSDDGAARVLAAAADAGVSLCEQPVAPGSDAPAGFARLRRYGVPLAADESCRTAAAMRPFLDAGAIDAVVVKPMATGLAEAIAMLDLAARHRIPAIITTTFDAAPGTAAAIYLAAMLPSPVPACGLATLDLLEHPLGMGVPAVCRGTIRTPAGPGLGIVLDDQALDRFATGPWREVAR